MSPPPVIVIVPITQAASIFEPNHHCATSQNLAQKAKATIKVTNEPTVIEDSVKSAFFATPEISSLEAETIALSQPISYCCYLSIKPVG